MPHEILTTLSFKMFCQKRQILKNFILSLWKLSKEAGLNTHLSLFLLFVHIGEEEGVVGSGLGGTNRVTFLKY